MPNRPFGSRAEVRGRARDGNIDELFMQGSSIIPSAEVHFQSPQLTITGEVVGMSGSEVVIRLPGLLKEPCVFAPGSAAQVVVHRANTAYVSSAQLLHAQGNSMRLGIKPLAKTTERRRDKRRLCELHCRYRAVHSDGRVGAWQHGVTSNISVSGLSLRLAPGTGIPKRIALCILLPSESRITHAAARLYSDSGAGFASGAGDERPVRATGTVMNLRPQQDGSVLAGVQFQQVAEGDVDRLGRFVDEEGASLAA
jgi:hypothetical protein